MGKLTKMIAEPVSLQDRLKISARRVRLAGIGLYSKADAERTRLYRQAMELGESYGQDEGLVGQLTRLGTGTVHLVIEESQRLFDELVEAGEQSLAGNAPKAARVSALSKPRPVARSVAPKPVADKAPEAKPAKPAKAATKAAKGSAGPALKSVKAAAKPAVEKDAAKKDAPQAVPAEALRKAFEQAKSRLNDLANPPDQATMLSLYALFKQATDGDVSGRRPGPTQLVERAKFDARQKIKGLPLADAMTRYIETVDRLLNVTA